MCADSLGPLLLRPRDSSGTAAAARSEKCDAPADWLAGPTGLLTALQLTVECSLPLLRRRAAAAGASSLSDDGPLDAAGLHATLAADVLLRATARRRPLILTGSARWNEWLGEVE